MYLYSAIVFLLLLPAWVLGQTVDFDLITSPTQDQIVVAGSTLDIIWIPTDNYTTDTVSLTLLEGTSPAKSELGDVIKGKPRVFRSFSVQATVEPRHKNGFRRQ